MRILFLGDIVGKPGYSAVLKLAGDLKTDHRLDAIVANAENASDGSGMMPRQFNRLMEAGVDAVTMGDHLYKRREIIAILEKSERIVKPANFPADASGRTWTIIPTKSGEPLAIVSLLGRVFMRPVDCPFSAADKVLAEIGDRAKHILVDVHAEATSDKQTIAHYLDGRVTAVLGTHTHVPTADARILRGGTAFQCDVGMCGPYDSIIGRDIHRVTETTRTFEPSHFHVATGDTKLCGAIVESGEDGRATSIKRFELDVQ
tara:strand:+ start:19760 stop:20539 length:780 start_codon:yes stop_codon:yes gene_type:complete